MQVLVFFGMLFYFITMLFLGCLFLMKKTFFIFEMSLSLLWVNFLTFSLKFDFFLVFVIMVVTVSTLIFVYSFYYMEKSILQTFFFLFKFLFVLSMLLLILGNNSLIMFFGWDGLGVTSYFLVMFYMNWKSNNSGYITILSNRVGDVFFIFLFCLFLTMGVENFYLTLFNTSFFLVLMLCFFFCVTKSAQYPFSTWLPLAMAAPTPISSLVHSSTLVTAGIFIILRFFEMLQTSSSMIFIFVVSFFTLFYSGIFSMDEMDMKKIVALSTLNQMSFMMFSISNGLKVLSFFHLCSHALFKSMLFLNVGIFIHSVFSLQDKRKYNMSLLYKKMVFMSFLLSLLGLVGFSFSSGFFSKDMILESVHFSKLSLILLVSIMLFMFFTFFYSFRLFCSLNKWKLNQLVYIFHNSLVILPSLVILSSLTLIFGKMFFQNFYSLWFILVNFSFLKFTLNLLFFGSLIFLSLKLMSVYHQKVKITSMFYLNLISIYFNKYLEKIMETLKNFLEKSFLELFLGKNVFSTFSSKSFLNTKKNYFYIIIVVFMIFIILLL